MNYIKPKMNYTCMKHHDSEYYDCYKGYIAYNEGNLKDYKIISIPNHVFEFDIIQNVFYFYHIKLKLRSNKVKMK